MSSREPAIIRIARTAALVALAFPAAAFGSTLQEVISIEGCASVGPWPAVLCSTQWPGDLADYLTPGGGTAVYLCDAELPDTATAFDSVELEYLGGDQSPLPWVAAYLDERVVGFDRNLYSWVEEIGWCGAQVTTSGSFMPDYMPPISVCTSSGGLSWAANPRAARSQLLSIFFLVFVPTEGPFGSGTFPPGPDPWMASPINWVFRLIVQYEK